jgi:hypothetical protein
VSILRDDNDDEPIGEVINCLFETSYNTINTVHLVSNCQFVKCKGEIFTFDGSFYSCNEPVRIEKCNIYNSSMTCYHRDDGIDTCYSRCLIYFIHGNEYIVSDCLFDGINCKGGITNKEIIDIYCANHDSAPKVTVKNCSFKNCVSEEDEEFEPIKIGEIFYTGVFNNKKTPVQYTKIINCQGLENINKESKEAKDIHIQTKTKNGILIGSTIEADEVGVGGFDPRTA